MKAYNILPCRFVNRLARDHHLVETIVFTRRPHKYVKLRTDRSVVEAWEATAA